MRCSLYFEFFGLISFDCQDLVWSGIGSELASLESIFWEHPEITKRLNIFRRVSRNAAISYFVHPPS